MSELPARWKRVLAMAGLELLHTLKDRVSLTLLLAVPVVQIILFGYAVNLNPKDVPLALAGPPEAAATLERVAEIAAGTGYLRPIGPRLEPGGAEAALQKGDALIALEFTGTDVLIPETRVIVDTTQPSTVGPALSALQTELLDYQSPVAGPLGALNLEKRFNPDSRTIWAIAPGLAGVVAMISMLLLSSLSLVRERERGTWEALAVMPVRRAEVLLGKMGPLLLLGCAQIAIVLALCTWLFDLPLGARPWPLLLLGPLFVAAHLAVGFTISASAATQVQAVQGAVMFYLPCVLMSGFMFPFSGMPGWAQALGTVLPLTHFVRAAREITLQDRGFEAAAPALLAVGVFLVAASLAALAAYRRRLD